MPVRGLTSRLVALAAAAGCVFVAVVALGAGLYHLLLMVLPAAAAAAVTAGLAALVALILALVFLRRSADDQSNEEAGLSDRVVTLFRHRPVLASVAALAGGWIFLRNPALASLVMAAFTEKRRGRRR